MGIARIPPVLLKPDWPAIVGVIIGLMLVLVTCLLLLASFQDLGWARKAAASSPHFRRLQMKFCFDAYSSKGSTVTAIKKYHPKLLVRGQGDEKSGEVAASLLEHDEFWDYEHQVDLEFFSANTFYEILLQQSLCMTAKLSQLKDELKVFYEKLAREVSGLRELCMITFGFSQHLEPCPSEVMKSYMKAKEEVELEITRRRKLAAEYEETVRRQLYLLQHDMKCHEEQSVLFYAALRESVRLLEVLKDSVAPGECTALQPNKDHLRLMSHLEAAQDRISIATMKECHRLKAWGVLGEGTGTSLVSKDRTNLLTKQDLFAPDGSVRAVDAIFTNHTTGLLTPNPDSVMLLANNDLMPVPDDFFVHTETGKVLPVAGNVGYDPIRSQFITTVDSASHVPGELYTSVFPYIPYPICPSTGLPPKTKMPNIQLQRGFQQGNVMLDPETGLEVPVLAVSIYPQTGQRLLLGGTYISPLTGIVTPIAIGGPMIDQKSRRIVPILGVSLDANIGVVVPLGGLRDSSGSLLLLGDTFCEPLSGKVNRVQGICLQWDDKVVPHAGSHQALLEANVLMAQIREL
ncbi:uncharacterized protein LOC115482137 [Microcaecilia unicolor]|uniref:Uncharacterized protein LOC115482137 n=1 Tax=Microcaecilia unicolor TaxID=1415580 RepID=A0A6P7ZVB1_9AMPH|nr:uncharacterized protein LOC115482137 [Microcaecilia unicolor]